MASTRRDFLLQSGMAIPALASMAHLATWASAADPFPGLIVRSGTPENLEYPFSSLRERIIPNDQFFVRSHFPVPKIDRSTWKLKIAGAVKEPVELTYDDLLKFPTRKIEATIECAGNGRVFLNPGFPGLQWGLGGVGNCNWEGVPLAAILEKVGLNDAAVDVVLEGADRGQVNTDPKSPGPISFARSIPVAKARKPEVLLAYRMNGKELPASHGFPLRALVAGWYGMSSVKWLTRIIVSTQPFQGFWQTMDYSYWERKDGVPTMLPLTTMQPKAAIAAPRLDERLTAGKAYRVFGAAWAGENAIAKVEVSADGGKTWGAAKLLDKPQPLTWTLWEWSWEVPAKPGKYALLAKATDTAGRTQPVERDTDRRSYMINHLIPIPVSVE